MEPGRRIRSALHIAEHYTDTGGATDHVFALCAMLGFRFCPRLRDFPDRWLIPIDLPAAYPGIAPLLGKRIRTDVIREHRDEVVRLVASLKAGHAAPSVMSRVLNGKAGISPDLAVRLEKAGVSTARFWINRTHPRWAAGFKFPQVVKSLHGPR